MREYPVFETKRLYLRPFMVSDAHEVQRLGGDRAVADMLFTLDLQAPGTAREWICHQHECFEKGEWINLAITDRSTGHLIGSVGLDIDCFNHNAEICYWLGKIYWGKGYATEAARAILLYGFNEIGLHRIYARYLSRNPASGRVLKKLGMIWEGRLRHHLKKDGVYENLEVMGILKSEIKPLQ